jgi:hypothetical protein
VKRYTNTQEVGEVQELTDVAVERLVKYGESAVSFSLNNPAVLLPLKNEILTKTALFEGIGLYRKHRVDDGWKNVSQVGLFGSTPLNHIPNKRRLPGPLLPSSWLLPKTHEAKKHFAESFRMSAEAAGMDPIVEGIDSLITLDFNRVGINRMNGSKENPSVISEYLNAPEQVGAVILINLFTQGMKPRSYIKDDNVTVVFGDDTCAAVGATRSAPSFESDGLRLGIAFSEVQPRRKN